MKRAVLLGLVCVACQAEVAVYKGFTLIDAAHVPAVAHAAMIVENGRITWVGAGGATRCTSRGDRGRPRTANM